jgi:hypothetical protein
VAQSILHTSGKTEVSSLTTIDVLTWVMDNTKAEAVHGLLEWASSGIHYRKTQLDRGAELVDEDWSLEALYQEKQATNTVARIIEAKADFMFEEVDDDLVSQICSRGSTYGLDDQVCVTSHTDECERELQVEEEIQQERELEVAQHLPAREKVWDYTALLRARSVRDLHGLVEVLDMQSYVRLLSTSSELATLTWSAAQIFVTENFASTVLTRTGMTTVNEFLRVCDVMLVFNNGQVLLVSECEADHILELLWSSTACNFQYVNLAFAGESIDRAGVVQTRSTRFTVATKCIDIHLALGLRLEVALPLLSTVGCHLFNGEAMVTKAQQSAVEPAFRALLRPLVCREATVSNFVKSRGNSHKWTRSFLHELCCRMDLEDYK